MVFSLHVAGLSSLVGSLNFIVTFMRYFLFSFFSLFALQSLAQQGCEAFNSLPSANVSFLAHSFSLNRWKFSGGAEGTKLRSGSISSAKLGFAGEAALSSASGASSSFLVYNY